MAETRQSAGATILAAVAGVSVWVSLGTLAVIDERSLARIMAMPPAWWLVPCIAIAVAIAAAVRLSVWRAWPLAISLLLWLRYLPWTPPPICPSGPGRATTWGVGRAAIAGSSQFTVST